MKELLNELMDQKVTFEWIDLGLGWL